MDDDYSLVSGKHAPPITAAAPVVAVKKRGRPAKLPAELGRPSPDALSAVFTLAELGWPLEEIATEIGIDVSHPEIVERFEAGAKAKTELPIKRKNWRPTPVDLMRVREYAAAGLTEIATASKMFISRSVFLSRLVDTPQLRDAFDQGNGEYHAKRLEEFNGLVDSQAGSLKWMTTPYIYLTKVGGMIDKPEKEKAAPIQVEVKHQHQLKAPALVPNNELANFAAEENERGRIASQKLLKIVDITE